MTLKVNNLSLYDNTQKTSSINEQKNIDKDIFTMYKETQKADNSKSIEANQKYWDAAMKIGDANTQVYKEVERLTGINDYKNLPIEAKNIYDKMNNYCNNMTTGELKSAMSSDDIENAIKKILNDVNNYKKDCLSELHTLYNKDNKNKNNLTNTESLSKSENTNQKFDNFLSKLFRTTKEHQ